MTGKVYKEVERNVCRIVLGGNHCPFVYFDLFLTIITTTPVQFPPASCMQSFRGITNTGQQACGSVGHIRGHGFILPIIRDWFFVPHGDNLLPVS